MTMMIYVPDFDKPNDIFEVDIIRTDDFYAYGSEKDKIYSRSHVFPLSARHAVLDICNKRYELFKAYKDSDSLIYQLRNAVARGEYK